MGAHIDILEINDPGSFAIFNCVAFLVSHLDKSRDTAIDVASYLGDLRCLLCDPRPPIEKPEDLHALIYIYWVTQFFIEDENPRIQQHAKDLLELIESFIPTLIEQRPDFFPPDILYGIQLMLMANRQSTALEN